VIEVSDSTLRYNRDVKVPLYARYGVPEAWVVDLQNARLLVHGGLRDGAYERHDSVERPQTMRVAAMPAVSIDLSGVFAA